MEHDANNDYYDRTASSRLMALTASLAAGSRSCLLLVLWPLAADARTASHLRWNKTAPPPTATKNTRIQQKRPVHAGTGVKRAKRRGGGRHLAGDG